MFKFLRYYRIDINHFYSFEYHEGFKTMVIDLDFRDNELYLETSLIKKWKPPFDKKEISLRAKHRILKNIRECLLDRWQPEEVIIVEEENVK